jgi:S1-C subfamily serine protease
MCRVSSYDKLKVKTGGYTMTEVLQNLSDALASTVEAAGPGVVRVEARRRLPASGIVWSSDGVILTAHHVVERDENIGVSLPDGQSATATLVGRDPTTDLAVLRTQSVSLTPPTWVEPESLRVGHLVLGLGRPGRTVQATLGIVSALGEGWRTPAGGRVEPYLQTDLVMYPGFSGGPLVDAAGRVLGLNTSALLRGVSLTVPTPTVRQVVETLLAHGRVRRGYLGVGAQPVRLPAALGEQLDQETGLLLVSVEPDGPADHGGFLLGDTIVAFDGQPVRHMDDLLALLSGDRVGASAPVRVVRGGQVMETTVTIGERP